MKFLTKKRKGGSMATTSTVTSSESGSVVTVIIPVDKNGEVEREPAPFRISKSLHQQVLWKASDSKAQFNIEFQEDSPFDYKQFSNLEPYSGLVRRDVLGDRGKYYKYTVRTGKKSIDPGGIVDA
jgi:hypothetical protein